MLAKHRRAAPAGAVDQVVVLMPPVQHPSNTVCQQAFV